MAHPPLATFRKLQEEAQALLEERHLLLPEDVGLSRGRRFLLFCTRVYRNFVRNRCPVRAAALAYTNLLALVPLLAVALSVSASFLKAQGEQSIQDWIRDGVKKIAPMLGLRQAAGNAFPLFSPDDIKDTELDRLVGRLQTGQDPLSRSLWNDRFSALDKSVLTNATSTLEQRKAALVAQLNHIVAGSSIYRPELFPTQELSTRTKTLLARNPQGPDAERLNHRLLADAYGLGEDALDSAVNQISGFVSNFQSGRLGVTAVLALIFVAISLLATIETTFNDIWGITRGRGWFARVVQYWTALSLGPMFLVGAFTLTTWAKLSQEVTRLPVVHFLMPFIVPLIILSVGCAVLYLVMPNTKVHWQAALLGGFTAGALLQINSYCNVLYVSRVLTYKQIYGSMATLPLFLLGLYFSWLLVLLGAQVAYAWQNRHIYVQERRADAINQRGRELAALRLMTEVGLRFQAGRPPPTGTELANELHLPLRLVSQLMTVLLKARLVVEVSGPENAYSPGRPLLQISFHDIWQALRLGSGQTTVPGETAAAPVVAQEFETVERALQQATSSITIEQVLRRISSEASQG